MPKVVVNIPRKKWIGRGWLMLTALVILAFAFAYSAISPLASGNERILFISLSAFVVALFAVIIYSFYNTKYVIRDGVLRSWSPFMTINLPLRSIRRVERTRVPYHIRVGASGYCGFFYIPGVGWTRTIMTNLADGVIIYAKDGKKYLITPSDPDRFVKLLKR